jgi:hypothetical protein
MRGDLHLVVVLAGLCTGCAYDGSDGSSQPNQLYGYGPEYTPPGEYYGYPPSYPPYGYAPYGSAPQYYPPAPSLGLGFGVFGGGGHREHERKEEWREHHDRGGGHREHEREEEWREHHNRGGERPRGFERGEGHGSGFNPPPAAINMPPATAHMPPPAFRPAPPPVAQRPPPPAAANARAPDRPGFRPNLHP